MKINLSAIPAMSLLMCSVFFLSGCGDTPISVPTPSDNNKIDAEEVRNDVENMIEVENQMLDGDVVNIKKVDSQTAGWLVIHSDKDGVPGPVIGYAKVYPGNNKNVLVIIDLRRKTDTLFAMLHSDKGVKGSYEFPGSDIPASNDAGVVVKPFALLENIEESLKDEDVKDDSNSEELPINDEKEEESVDEEPVIEEEPATEVDNDPEPAPLPDSEEETTPEVETEPISEAVPAPTVKSFTMTATQFSFSPSTITVNKGDTVRLTITSTDTDHGISISAFGVNSVVAEGETKVIEFVADKSGSFPFVCSVFCGGGHGSMRGTLIVR